MQSPRPGPCSPTHSIVQQEGEGYGKEEENGGGCEEKEGEEMKGEGGKGSGGKKERMAQVFF